MPKGKKGYFGMFFPLLKLYYKCYYMLFVISLRMNFYSKITGVGTVKSNATWKLESLGRDQDLKYPVVLSRKQMMFLQDCADPTDCLGIALARKFMTVSSTFEQMIDTTVLLSYSGTMPTSLAIVQAQQC